MNGPRPVGYNITCKAQSSGTLGEVSSAPVLSKEVIERRKERRHRMMVKKKEANEARRRKEQEALEATKRTAIAKWYKDSRILKNLGLSKFAVQMAVAKYANPRK